MKLLLLVVLLGCSIAALSAQDTAISGINVNNVFELDFGKALRMYLKAFKRVAPCGYAPWNLPSMDPFRLDHYTISENNENLKVNGDVSNLILRGIDDFIMIEYDYDDATNTLTYDVLYPEIQVLGDYNISTWGLFGGVPLSMAGEGLLNMKFVDLRFSGGFSITPNSEGGLSISNFALNTYLGDAMYNNWNTLWSVSVNNFVNRFQREITLLIVEEYPAYIANIYNKALLPALGGILANTTMTEAINFLVEASAELNMAECH